MRRTLLLVLTAALTVLARAGEQKPTLPCSGYSERSNYD
jgi:hypothetical protein